MGKASRRKRVRGERDVVGAPSMKVSACLIEVTEPYREHCKTRESYRRLLSLASAAWNLSVLSPDKRQDIQDQLLQIFPEEDRPFTLSLLERLIDRKEELFPNDKRFVAGADVLDDGDDFRVVAASLSGRK